MKTEFEFLGDLKSRYKLRKIGDDAAVLPKDDTTDQVISTDLLIEDIDFRLKWTTPNFIGHKVLAVSISDITAMGAVPKYSLVSIGIPEKLWKTDFVDKFYEGYFSLGNDFDQIELVGGDISKSPEKIVIDSIVIGEVEKGKAVLRSGAKVGDLIFVTGELGGASAGLKLLENGIRYNDTENWQRNLLLAQLKPNPFFNASDFNEFATSMIDISDGLSGDLMHICEASKVGAKIFADKIPINKKIDYLFSTHHKKYLSENLDKLYFALHGGEDFELLFTVDQEVFQKNRKKILDRFYLIGEITENVKNIELIKGVQIESLYPKGYQHF